MREVRKGKGKCIFRKNVENVMKRRTGLIGFESIEEMHKELRDGERILGECGSFFGVVYV